MKGANGDVDLADVFGAAPAAGEVRLELAFEFGWEHAVEVVGDEFDELLAGELVVFRRHVRARAAGGHEQQDRDEQCGRGQEPAGPVHSVCAGERSEHERERQEQHPGQRADAGGHTSANVGRHAVVQEPAGPDADDRQ